MKGAGTLIASVAIAGMTVAVGWNGHGAWTLGIYMLAVIGAWCCLLLLFGGIWALAIDHWRKSAAETTRPGAFVQGRRRRPGLVASSPGPDAATTPSGGHHPPSGLGVHLVPNLGSGGDHAQKSHAARELDARRVGRGDKRPVAPLGRDQVSIRLHHQRTRWP